MMKQIISIMLIVLMALSVVNVALAAAPAFDVIGDHTTAEGEHFYLNMHITDSDLDVTELTLVEDSYTSESSSYDESTDFYHYIHNVDDDVAAASLQWYPTNSDIGDHVFIFTVTDTGGNEVSESFTVTVMSQYENTVLAYEELLVELEAEVDHQIDLFDDAVEEDDSDDLWEVRQDLGDLIEELDELTADAIVHLEVIDEANDDDIISDELTAMLENRLDSLFTNIDHLLETIDWMQAYINNGIPSFVEASSVEATINEGDTLTLAIAATDRFFEDNLVITGELTDFTSTSSSLDLSSSSLFYESSSEETEWQSSVEYILEWTPTNDDVGLHYVTFTVIDSFGAEDTTEIVIEVVDVNQHPTVESISDQTVTINTEINVAETFEYQLVAEDRDGDSLEYHVRFYGDVTGNPDDEIEPMNAPQVDANGLLTWTPAVQEAGRVFDAHVMVEDEHSAMSNEVEFKIFVNGQTAPVIQTIADQTVVAGETVSLQVSAQDASAIVLTASGLDSAASFVDNGDGTANLEWVTTSSNVGTSVVTITATDADGEFSTETFTIAVEAETGHPVIDSVNDQTANAGEEFTLAITATDAEGQEITFSTSGLDSDAQTSETTGDSGSDTLTITWTPTDADAGDYSVTVTATDAGGLSSSASFTLTVVNEIISGFEQEIEDLEVNFEDLEDEFLDDDLEDAYDDAVQDNDADEIEEATEDLENLLEDLEDLLDDIENLREDINEAEDDDDLSRSQEDDLEDQLDDLEEDVQDLIDEIENILGIDNNDQPAILHQASTGSASSGSTSSTSGAGADDDVEVDTTFLQGEDSGNDSTTVVGSISSFDEIRPLLWLGAGIIVAFALLIFGLALLFSRK